MNKPQYLSDNLQHVEQRIVRACRRVGRDRNEITLLAVTKTVATDVVNASIELGIEHIGENKPQEIVRKYPDIVGDVSWHMIGHLQSNKVKQIIDKVALIHSVDRSSVIAEIEKRAAMISRTVDVLVQVNIGEESQKSGVATDQLNQLLTQLDNCGHIRVKGLMCIAPYLVDPEAVRPYFKQMKQLYDQLRSDPKRREWQVLSMGMTHDCEVAIEEGATLIRVGTGIYGERH